MPGAMCAARSRLIQARCPPADLIRSASPDGVRVGTMPGGSGAVNERQSCPANPPHEPDAKNDAGIWLEYGAARNSHLRNAASKPTYPPALSGLSKTEKSEFSVDFETPATLYTPSRHATPPRRDDVSQKLLTGIVNQHPMVLGCAEFRRPFRGPCCLKTE